MGVATRPSRGRNAPAIPGLAPRHAAAEIIAAVLGEREPLDAVLDRSPSPLDGLSPADRSLARAILSTALRHAGQIDAAMAALMERPLPRRSGPMPSILTAAAAQILFMEVADHAAVSLALADAEADPDARHFKGVANGVLRNLTRRRDEILAAQNAARLNTPDWLWNRWTATFGADGAQAIGAAHLVEPPLDLGVRGDAAAWAEKLGGLPFAGGVRLAAKGRVEQLPGYDDGAWWVQDAAASLPARLLGDVAGKDVLDLCAAPGGKTAQLAAAGARVTALDVSEPRMNRLRENLARLGLEAATVVADARSWNPGKTFDAILLDAPCSATGTVRRHPDIPWLKREANLAELAHLQARLLDRATALVRPGGLVVYATCSLEPEEGMAQADAALSRLPLDPVPVAPDELPGLDPGAVTGGRLRTLPHHAPAPGLAGGMDGFFAARFRRR